MNDEISLLMLWMDLCMSQQSNLKSLTRKTYNSSMIENRIRGTQQVKYVENTLHFSFVLIYESKMDQN